ncbi:MAG: hypothetical protein A2Z21_00260 [Candidatus Fraserbacteria bacterium RBG_16_55_9]|uniref:ComEC/Rec2-related protein domain-containing protein n=1 Tax=Fraserbacteria sp. (strain RBG_16_55_9) TaxID=1817864 RepID=A0A1F5UPU0_FRAXR|nr:MAG: hypothetical protein A2Z21_00260 [Candidatus Fraserbacteria bacterium RBG_16_55_9]
MLFITLAWMLGILLGRELSPTPLYAWLAVIGLLFLSAILYRFQCPPWPLMLLVLTMTLGALFYLHARLPLEKLYPLLENLKSIRGIIVSYPDHRPERSSFVLQPEGLPGLLQIFYYHPNGKYKSLDYGDELSIEARFEIPWQFEDFSYREHLLTRNIWAVGSLWSAQQIHPTESDRGNAIVAWGYQARLSLFELIDQYIPQPGSGLLKGLLFGERAYLSDDIESGFRDAGVMHVLAVSGMNLGILVGLFWAFLRLFRLSATQIHLVLLPLVFAYLVVVGFEVSLIRASLMYGFITLGWVVAERGWILRDWIDPLHGLSAAALMILVWTPQALFDVSFQLSFAATAGIIIAAQCALPLLEEQRERLRLQWDVASSFPKRALFRLGELVALFVLISLAAQLAVAPILAYHFHRVYLAALFANLVIVPLSTVALWLGVFVVCSAALPLMADYWGTLEGWLLERLIDSTQFFAHLPGAYLMIDGAMQSAFLVVLPLLLSADTRVGAELVLSSLTRSCRILQAENSTSPEKSLESP